MTVRTPQDAHRELLERIGDRGPSISGTVCARDIERFAVATNETSPIYTDEAAAREAGYDGLPSPPMMLPAMIEWGAGPSLDTLRPDGTGVGRESWLPLDGLRLMGGGQDLIFHAPVLSGTAFVAEPRLESVELKEGSSGAMVLIGIVTEFRDAGGGALVTCHETLIGR